jgi:hypothetical protein
LPLLLFGIPSMEDEETKFAIGIPRAGQLDPDPYLGRPDQGPEGIPAERTSGRIP